MATDTLPINGFAVSKRSGSARLGCFMTRHGAIETPAFMPVGTQASVKSVSSAELAESGARLFIANTYHLWLRPGLEVIERFGGLHAFMRWPHAIATDSGGFQAFSLAERVRVDEDGYLFASHLDGSKLRLSPEEAMRIQGTLGSDIAMQLDVCLKAGVSHAELAAAVQRTERWGERCLASRREGQALFAIVQGGLSLDLRLAHARSVATLPYDGIALGGFSVGESPTDMHAVLAQLVPELDASRPHYLMGVGTPSDVIRAIGVGVDLFDCVIPTRNARNGQVFTQRGKLAIRNAQHRLSDEPIDAACHCPACAAGYSRAYLRHLFIANEILALRLLTLHNLHFYQEIIKQARVAIAEDRYGTWAQAKLAALEAPAESL